MMKGEEAEVERARVSPLQLMRLEMQRCPWEEQLRAVVGLGAVSDYLFALLTVQRKRESE